ncbi:ribonuclease E/G [Gemmobacter fulvus]|uniref:Ribonuclease E n=1 Tax=Gemmobacter fulvus TaxID=2840474 RepID=A0A975P702_9RHOB|nr:ribonuclease E/G [Gemmobacter fulvus]MBT9244095.1 ribonuclease E/G [Gemmobacter fulvus]QWK91000.1 ribonuclease E/G [Gemmobacter fulvus]
MAKKMLIDATHAEETRVVVVDGNKVEEFDFETVNKRQLQGNIYLAKVTRVEPSLQAAFVDYGGNRHGFLAFAEIHPDYYQIPVADRKALLDEERALARAEEDEDNRSRSRSGGNRNGQKPRPNGNGNGRSDAQAEAVASDDAVISAEVADAEAPEIKGMDVVDLGEETGADALFVSRNADRAEIASERSQSEAHYEAVDHAADVDDEIESVAEEDVAEEIRAPRKPRARRYKIQEVIKMRQIMLVQVVKEERGNKGAALTTYLSLAGRYCVLMPNTARGGGISRKITQAADRKKLKEIAGEMEVPEGAGLIIRTAGAKRTKPEIKRDYEYLMRLWEQIRELTLRSIAPAPIYEEGDLIKRSIRDLYNREIDEVLVEGEGGYRTAKDFMRMIMPSHAKVVQRYAEPMPLFARYQVESYLAGMFNPVVQLKSGGYIVIGVTEALVAIDVNSGRATKEGSIEETALKTNLEAADEVARQLRLRDLAGLIVIDFIDMEERRNNASVEKRLKDKLKTDRARIQVGRISGFGLMEMSRQRLRPGMLESTTQPCPHCHGTGLIRSDDSLALQILRALEEEGTRKRSKEVLLKAPVAVINYLINNKREHIALIEARYGMAVRLEADPHMISPDFSIEKFKTAVRVVPDMSAVISGNAALMGAPVAEEEEDPDLPLDEEEDEADEAEAEARGDADGEGNGEGGNGSKKKRRRRRRGRGGSSKYRDENGNETGSDDEDEDDLDGEEDEAEAVEAPAADAVTAPVATMAEAEATVVAEAMAEVAVAEAEAEVVAKPAAKSSKSAAGKAAGTKTTAAKTSKPATSKAKAPKAAAAEKGEAVADAAEPAPKLKSTRTRTTSSAKAKAKAAAEAEAAAAAPEADVAAAPVVEAPVAAPVAEVPPQPAAPVLQADPGMEPVLEAVSADPAEAEAAEDDEPKAKRKGWWSLGR